MLRSQKVMDICQSWYSWRYGVSLFFVAWIIEKFDIIQAKK